MSHLETRYVVNGRIESDDTALLDTIETELPNEDSLLLGNEYNLNRSPVLDAEGNETGTEVLSGRMTFASDDTEFAPDADGFPKLVVDEGSDTDADGNPVPADDEILRENVSDSDIYGPAEAAQQFHQQIVSHDLANKADGWRVWVYQSPEGGVTADDVRAWYEEDETRQPRDQDAEPVEEEQVVTDENGDPILDENGDEQYETVEVQPRYVPDSFDPSNHVVAEESG